MAFESLGEKLQQTFKKLKGHGKVSEKDIKEAMREIKMALLEADVNFKVVKSFENAVKEKALGSEVMESLTPGQQIIKIVRDELTALMGGENSKLTVSPKPPTVIMMVGLQGAGKTTTTGKLATYLKKQGKKPLLVACDVYRPAAVKQLEVVAGQCGAGFFSKPGSNKPVEIAKEAVKKCDLSIYDTVIIDTAGRLHIDEELMGELVAIKEAVEPDEILLVVDAMTGQDAVNVAESFNNQLDITGVVLAKMDSDTRGGAALSVRAVTGKPIKFAASGEKMDDLEQFYPDRMASRILGLGDVLSLIDRAEEAMDIKKAEELEKKLREASFNLNDFLDQMEQMKKMGPMENILGMLPGINTKALQGASIDEKQMERTAAIIKSMTKKERENSSIINASRKRRIAAGSGTDVKDVNVLLNNYENMKKMIKQMTGNKMMKKFGKKFPFGM
ncbi:MAG: signal recognition particle protein [Bacillota bacterium]|nr:signal recognition particle protein [Bacillota bacterium]